MAEERVQRRLAAILAADVVGYSRLIETDEKGTRARLRSLQSELIEPQIAGGGGRIVKTMGDGILVEFPSAVDAVSSAFELFRTMRKRNADVPEEDRIEFRVGINVGDVIVEGDDIHGDGVNVAARLQALCEPGEIYVSGTVYDQAAGKVLASFEDLGEKTVKNITKPVRVYRIKLADQDTSRPPSPVAMLRRPAVAVLPFENMSTDAAQDYFADGLTEDIITALSLWRSFPVIARNSTNTYKGQAIDVRKVAKDLDARYVLEGSVRIYAERIRVTAQLIDATTGHHVWAERIDRDLNDLFIVQDEIAQKISASVAPELERAEQRRSFTAGTQDLDAWGYYQRGMSHLVEYSQGGNQQARDMFERAIALDQNYAEPLIGLAYCNYQEVRWSWTKDIETKQAEIFQLVRRAIELDEMDAKAHWMLGLGYQILRRFDRAIAEGESAVALNPNFALAYFGLGGSYLFGGQPKSAVGCLETAIQLNPRDPRNFIVYTILAHAHLILNEYEKAVETANKALPIRPDFMAAHVILASSLGHLGNRREAADALEEFERVRPGHLDTLKALSDLEVYGEAYDYRALGETHLLDGLRKAKLLG
ncbi:MAG: tetratricopeptide repeat protein [Alphaproteobacteria bacterium]